MKRANEVSEIVQNIDISIFLFRITYMIAAWVAAISIFYFVRHPVNYNYWLQQAFVNYSTFGFLGTDSHIQYQNCIKYNVHNLKG